MSPDSKPPTGLLRRIPRLSRRRILEVCGLAALGWGLGGCRRWWNRDESGLRAEVFIGKAASYDSDLVSVVTAGLEELGLGSREVRGRRVLLKPNLVETSPGKTCINTHPTLVSAAAEVFRSLGAAEVIVAEGQGHRRDSWLVLDESGMGQALAEAGLRFVDLNHDDVHQLANRGGWTRLKHFYLPQTLQAADLVVSMPKLKTHHWAGVTCAMKNLFGVIPGIVYGWPKNLLHWVGIANSILDLHTTVRPSLAIVDGIVGMEGDGPIMGNPKTLGALVVGRNLPAVDATSARLMRLSPFGLDYLTEASGRLGPIEERNIEQRGERIRDLATAFDVLGVPHLRSLRRI
jgi:uncharacterized protein (DUF362 family)